MFDPRRSKPSVTALVSAPAKAAKPKRERPTPLPNALAYRVDEVALMGGPRRTKLYELAKAGKLKLIRVEGRTLVEGNSLRRLLGVEAD
jgi:hypothetical protein